MVTKSGVSNQITTENCRRESSTLIVFFLYQIENNKIICKTTIYGIRYLEKTGINEYYNSTISDIVKTHAIGHETISCLLNNNYIFKEKFILSKKDLVLGQDTISYSNIPKYQRYDV